MKNYHIISKYDGLVLSVMTTEPSGKPRGIVQISHGMSEHKERYLPFMEYLSENGYACIIHDHRGHGQSIRNEKDLGYLYDQGEHAIILDMFQITDFAKRQWRGLPLFLLGHSMGSLTARCYIQKKDDGIQGVILSGSPGLNWFVDFGILLCDVLALFRGGHRKSLLLSILAIGPFEKGLKKGMSVNTWICSDEAVVKEYDESKLCGYPYTINGYRVIFSLLKQTYNRRVWERKKYEKGLNTSLPIHFLSGERDLCMGGKRGFYHAHAMLTWLGYECVTSKLYPGMLHEIINEREKELVWQDILELLEEDRLI